MVIVHHDIFCMMYEQKSALFKGVGVVDIDQIHVKIEGTFINSIICSSLLFCGWVAQNQTPRATIGNPTVERTVQFSFMM